MSVGYGLTARMQKHIKAGGPLYLFGELDHPDGMVRLWTGIGDIEWNGETWLGRGKLARLGQVQSSEELMISDRVMSIVGVDPAQLSLLTGNVRNRVATFWIAGVDRGRVIADPYLLDEVLMDAQAFPVDENGQASIVITGFSGIWTLERAQEIVWSSEEAKTEYPAETGFDLINELAQKEVRWTRT